MAYSEAEVTQILLQNDKRVKAVFDAARSKITALTADQDRAVDALDIDTSFEIKSGVVTQDRLTIAVHLMVAKLLFHVMPEHWKSLLAEQVTNFVTAKTAKFAALKATKKIPGAGQVIALLQGLMSVPSRLLWQAKTEKDIREACAKIRKEMNEHALTQKKKKGKVRDVITRHRTKRHSKHFRGCKSK